MFRYRLRTLLILTILGPPVLAGAWFAPQKIVERYRQWQWDRLVYLIETTVTGSTGEVTDTEESH